MNIDSKSTLNGLKLRATPSRIAILDFLQKETNPIDINSIISYLEKKQISTNKATVFRILNIFTQKGITNHIQFHEGKARYELVSRGDHHHFICENCGEILEISECTVSQLEKKLQKMKGLLIKRHSLEFFGLCKNCY